MVNNFKDYISSNLKLILLVGTYPQYSETFIIRKAIALQQRGCEVLIMARAKGNLSLLNSYDKSALPKIEYLPSDKRPSSLRGILATSTSIIYKLLTSPKGFLRLALNLKKIGRFKLKYLLRYLPFINKGYYQLVHAEFFGLGMYYEDLKELINLPYVTSGRGTDINLLPLKPNVDAERRFCKKIDKLHLVSEDLQNRVVDLSLIDPTKIFVNRPAVISATGVKNASSNASVPCILSVGRLVWIKGYDYLLQAYSILVNEGVSFKAYIVGDGPLYNELNFSIRDLGLEDSVTLCGPLPADEVEKKMMDADIFALPSHAEGINNSVLEAMRMGVPVVCTAIGGMKEVIEDHKNGILTSPRDPREMANALRELLNSVELRVQLAAEGSRTIEEEFTLELQANVFYSNYQSIFV